MCTRSCAHVCRMPCFPSVGPGPQRGSGGAVVTAAHAGYLIERHASFVVFGCAGGRRRVMLSCAVLAKRLTLPARTAFQPTPVRKRFYGQVSSKPPCPPCLASYAPGCPHLCFLRSKEAPPPAFMYHLFFPLLMPSSKRAGICFCWLCKARGSYRNFSSFSF